MFFSYLRPLTEVEWGKIVDAFNLFALHPSFTYDLIYIRIYCCGSHWGPVRRVTISINEHRDQLTCGFQLQNPL
jgi:hypothetical protein